MSRHPRYLHRPPRNSVVRKTPAALDHLPPYAVMPRDMKYHPGTVGEEIGDDAGHHSESHDTTEEQELKTDAAQAADLVIAPPFAPRPMPFGSGQLGSNQDN